MVAVEVSVPAFLLELTSGATHVSADGATVRDAIASLDLAFPGIGERLLDDSGLRRYVNVYLNGREIRFAQGLDTAVGNGDALTILPTIAAG